MEEEENDTDEGATDMVGGWHSTHKCRKGSRERCLNRRIEELDGEQRR